MFTKLRRRLGAVLLPLTMIPFMTFLFVSASVHGAGVRLHGGEKPWEAPAVTLTAADLQYKPPRNYHHSGGIPVLLYHGINYQKSDTTMTPEQFATEMAFLQHLGYKSISIYQYIAWREGKHPPLPARPILITFDDARFDTYRGADRILAKYHMQATIYVIVGQVEAQNRYYTTWDELKKMQKSGRWDIQFHAYRGHAMVPKDATGTQVAVDGVCTTAITKKTAMTEATAGTLIKDHCGPFYSTREWLPAKGRIETMAEFTSRVTNELIAGLKVLRGHGFTDLKTMAMPFGEYGQTTEDNGDYNLTVEQQLAKIMPQYFVTLFVQSGHAYTPYSSPVDRGLRLEPHADTTLAQIYEYLYHGNPAVIATLKRTCKPPKTFDITVYQGATCSKY